MLENCWHSFLHLFCVLEFGDSLLRHTANLYDLAITRAIKVCCWLDGERPAHLISAPNRWNGGGLIVHTNAALGANAPRPISDTQPTHSARRSIDRCAIKLARRFGGPVRRKANRNGIPFHLSRFGWRSVRNVVQRTQTGCNNSGRSRLGNKMVISVRRALQLL